MSRKATQAARLHMAALGRAGAAARKKLPLAQRQELARKAVQARWKRFREAKTANTRQIPG
jgi:hypothetical protein